MAVEIIKVWKKNNHSLTRTIQKAALSIFERRGWEPIEGEEIEGISVPLTVGAKKNVAAPAEAPEKETDPFAKVGDEQEAPERSIESLREEYEQLSGSKADKRWNAKRLADEISNLK